MLEFHNVKVSGLESSIISCRYAMMTEMPNLSDPDVYNECFEKGISRARKLAVNGGGSGHTSFRKGIRVEFDMKYTQYITKQFQRYGHFDYISSSSLMHRITQMDFTKCVNKYVTQETIDEVEKWKDLYNKILEDDSILEYMFDTGRDGFKTGDRKSTLYVAWMILLSNCPMGTELFVHVNTNYEQLATIYGQRKHHKLVEDYEAFLNMVEDLPYSELITCTKDGK